MNDGQICKKNDMVNLFKPNTYWPAMLVSYIDHLYFEFHYILKIS